MADADAVRKQRQKQLEDKRRRLEELRKRKKVRSQFTLVLYDSYNERSKIKFQIS